MAVNTITKADFVDGEKTRDGESVDGSTYDAVVDAANAGTVPSSSSSAHFSEQALDPYEVKNAQ